MVLGVRVHGDIVTDVSVAWEPSDRMFLKVDLPSKMGVPLMWTPSSEEDAMEKLAHGSKKEALARILSSPIDGSPPPRWLGPAPPSIVLRSDNVPFSVHDFDCLDAYISERLLPHWRQQDDMQRLSTCWRAIEPMLSPSMFGSFVINQPDKFPKAFLCLRFPLGAIVVASGLSDLELNGTEGIVTQYGRDRVGVSFPALPHRPVAALRPERLTFLCEPDQVQANDGGIGDDSASSIGISNRSDLLGSTVSSDSSMLSTHGPHCFLPDTLLPSSSSCFQRVDEFKEGDLVQSFDGIKLTIKSMIAYQDEPRPCTLLCAGNIVNIFTEGHRVSIQRAGKRQAVKAGTLRQGDDVFISDGSTQSLTTVIHFQHKCPVYEFAFEPDLPVRSFSLPQSILSHGRKPPRWHRRPQMPDTDSELGFPSFHES